MKLRKVAYAIEVYAESTDEEAALNRLSTHPPKSGIVVEKHDLGSLIYFSIFDPSGNDVIERFVNAQHELNELIEQSLDSGLDIK